jgi:hypothetical protein
MARAEEPVYISYKILVVGLLVIMVLAASAQGFLTYSWVQPTQTQSGFLNDLSKISQTILGALIGLLGGKATR